MSENKERKDDLTKKEAISILEMLRQLMDAYGFFAENLGGIQKSNQEAFDSMFSIETFTKLPEIANRITEQMPEIGKLYTTIILRMSALVPRISNLMDLSADEKINLGKNLKVLSREINKLQEHVERL